jgi:hypothetical protein
MQKNFPVFFLTAGTLFSVLKSLKKGVGYGSIGQRYGSPDPDPLPNVTDPQHCWKISAYV